nr:uncharacterized protein LOC109153761 [Ipomoea batatas]
MEMRGGMALEKGKRRPLVWGIGCSSGLELVSTSEQSAPESGRVLDRGEMSTIDTGSSANVMYLDVFMKLGFAQDQLHPVKTPLVGFTGDTIETEGSIWLSVELGIPPNIREVEMAMNATTLPNKEVN